MVGVKIPATLPAVMHAIAHPSSLATFRKQKTDEKDRALRVFKALHAHEIHYWGAWSFEDTPPPETLARRAAGLRGGRCSQGFLGSQGGMSMGHSPRTPGRPGAGRPSTSTRTGS